MDHTHRYRATTLQILRITQELRAMVKTGPKKFESLERGKKEDKRRQEKEKGQPIKEQNVISLIHSISEGCSGKKGQEPWQTGQEDSGESQASEGKPRGTPSLLS